MAGQKQDLLLTANNPDLVRRLAQARVEFLIAGGVAVQFYGCREWSQLGDLDLLVNPTEDNARRCSECLGEPGVDPAAIEQQLQRPKSRVHLRSRVSDYLADFLTPDADIDFTELRARAQPTVVGEVEVLVISRGDLIEMKRRAIESLGEELEKHKRDLERLRGV